jgi:hypothetical protein
MSKLRLKGLKMPGVYDVFLTVEGNKKTRTEDLEIGWHQIFSFISYNTVDAINQAAAYVDVHNKGLEYTIEVTKVELVRKITANPHF